VLYSVKQSFSILLLACLLTGCDSGSSSHNDSAAATDTENTDSLNCEEIIPGATAADDYVCAHNAARAIAQPTPSPSLPVVSWDEDLAEIARAYAETCVYAHNADRSNDYPGYVGENIFIRTPSPASAETVVTAWASENQFYNYASNSCQQGEVCGHYTQIVWRDSIKIGCGTAACSDISVDGNIWSDAHIVVCNYSPGGNVTGQKPY
jgi:uncharacterized protein YkwD